MTLSTDQIRARLLARRQELMEVADSGDEAAQTVELDQTRVGRLSRMDALQGQAMSKEAKRRREEELKRISIALAHLDDGDYGLCIECGEQIGPQRLEADPSAMWCIQCAERHEQ